MNTKANENTELRSVTVSFKDHTVIGVTASINTHFKMLVLNCFPNVPIILPGQGMTAGDYGSEDGGGVLS